MQRDFEIGNYLKINGKFYDEDTQRTEIGLATILGQLDPDAEVVSYTIEITT